ncbi:aspartate/glutamate racemase family protein [Paracoccus sp. YLB-12]|uniref:Aspartate/glutamate racemase family protein n=1 Tax=Paracoccus maritimus TaxID=2933292 RepID=A0ABT2K6X4_9RHOB|nr:aspartate/glutamate racemase family protein [Paracoccus sp. YLB-12]MCT4331669.1 aspartate/glutamate racemase family protein [Paracoccus sp. YLB-12]
MPSFPFSTLRPIQRLLPALGLFTALMGSAVLAETKGNTILLINPNSNQTATQSMTELAAEAAGEDVTVLGKSNSQAPALLTTPQDMIDAVSGVVAIGQAAAEDPAIGAIIVAAFSDPGLEELRNAVDLPVFGIGEEVFHEAARDGRDFSIVTVTPNEDLIESFRQKAASLGYEAQYRGTRVTEGDPNELVQSPEKLDAALAKVFQVAVEQDNAQAVIMGGGPLSASALRLQPDFEVPLVVAVNAAARAAAAAIAAQD